MSAFLSKMFDVGDLPVLTFGNWVLKAEWLSELWNYMYVFLRFFNVFFSKSKKTWLFTFFWVVAHVFPNSDTGRFLADKSASMKQAVNSRCGEVRRQLFRRRICCTKARQTGSRRCEITGSWCSSGGRTRTSTTSSTLAVRDGSGCRAAGRCQPRCRSRCRRSSTALHGGGGVTRGRPGTHSAGGACTTVCYQARDGGGTAAARPASWWNQYHSEDDAWRTNRS